MASPAFFLTKPNGSLRLLIDFRGLNKYLRRSPTMGQRFERFCCASPRPGAFPRRTPTSGTTHGDLPRRAARSWRSAYRSESTSICVSPWVFHRARRVRGAYGKIFGGLDSAVVYLDDILVFSTNEREHSAHLRIVFKRLAKYGVTLDGKEVPHLARRVGLLGLHPLH